MSRRTFLGGCVILIVAVAGCYTGGDVTTRSTTAATPATTVDMTDPSATSVTGVPCDVAAVLARDCASCHNTTPRGGAPNAMMSYDDLMAPSTSEKALSIAAVSVLRMEDTTNPMPPDGAPAADLAILAKWVSDGMPKGTEVCDATPAASIYDTDPVCTTNKSWTGGDRGSVSMRPGGACNKCHDSSNRGPSYYAAGTVYATAHEPDDCNGVPSSSSKPIKVVVKDAKGTTYTATVNAVGNFYFDNKSPIQMPYKAWVTSGSKTRRMSAASTDGDCNKCHSEDGTKNAPGRIMAP